MICITTDPTFAIAHMFFDTPPPAKPECIAEGLVQCKHGRSPLVGVSELPHDVPVVSGLLPITARPGPSIIKNYPRFIGLTLDFYSDFTQLLQKVIIRQRKILFRIVIIKLPHIIEPNPIKPPSHFSTRLNSSHVAITYAVFCYQKKID